MLQYPTAQIPQKNSPFKFGAEFSSDHWWNFTSLPTRTQREETVKLPNFSELRRFSQNTTRLRFLIGFVFFTYERPILLVFFTCVRTTRFLVSDQAKKMYFPGVQRGLHSV